MSSAAIIVAIICLLGILVSYAFIQQTLTNKREQRLRLTNTLKSSARRMAFMLNGFPHGFLSRQLLLLIRHKQIEVYDKLTKLEPGEPRHLQELQAVTAQMSENRRQEAMPERSPLENHRQIKEARASLEELNNFIHELEQRQDVPPKLAKAYHHQVKQMALQLSVDGHCLNGGQARQSGKTKLAIHYYELALNLILREAKSQQFKTRVARLRQDLEQLRKKREEEAQLPPSSDQEHAENNDGGKQTWDDFTGDGGDWKKRNVYD